MTDGPEFERYESARRFAERLSDHYGIEMQVRWSLGELGDVWTVTWTDGPAPDEAVVGVAKDVAQELGDVRGRLQMRRALSPWAWLWALRNAQAGQRLAATADEAVDLIGAELLTEEIPTPVAAPEVHLAQLALDEAPPLALAQFVIDQAAGGRELRVATAGAAAPVAAGGVADTSPISERAHLARRSGTHDGTKSGSGDSPPPSPPGATDRRPKTRDESNTAGSGGRRGARPEIGNETASCERCGNTLPPRAGTGRTARFCNTRCRQAAHRASQRDPAANTQRHCERCLKPLDTSPRPGRQRRWCSDACRAAASRDRLRDSQPPA